MIIVRVKNPGDDESFGRACSKFKKICNKDGFLREIRDRRYFKKPSEKRQEKLKSIQRERELKKKRKRKLY
jgi:ribosomal protein S21